MENKYYDVIVEAINDMTSEEEIYHVEGLLYMANLAKLITYDEYMELKIMAINKQKEIESM